jgi:hypothetical protein
MTAKEKAEELVNKFIKHTHECCKLDAKQCALISVDEILNLCWNGNEVGIKYWHEVKNEIQKL